MAVRGSWITKLLAVSTLTALLAAGGTAYAAESSSNWSAAIETPGDSMPAATASWTDDNCYNAINFDPRKYDEARLKNTIHLLFGPPDFRAPWLDLPFDPKYIARLNLERTKQECKAALETADRLKFIPLEGIEEYRRGEIAYIKDICEFHTVEIRGYRNPSALREYRPAVPVCSRFIDALEGKADLVTVFSEVVQQNCSHHVSPSECVKQWYVKVQRSNKVEWTEENMEWVRLYLTTFGWHNCANKLTIRTTNSKRQEQLRARLEQQFRSLFKVTSDCDEGGGYYPGAIIDIDNAPGNADGEWRIKKQLGLFCQSAGSAKGHPRGIELSLFEVRGQSFKNMQPIEATLDIDGKATQFTLPPIGTMAMAPIGADVVRQLLHARTASVLFKGPEFAESEPTQARRSGAENPLRFEQMLYALEIHLPMNLPSNSILPREVPAISQRYGIGLTGSFSPPAIAGSLFRTVKSKRWGRR